MDDDTLEAKRAALLGDLATVRGTVGDRSHYARAIARYDDALPTLREEEARLLNNRAFAAWRTGDKAGAIADFRRASEGIGNDVWAAGVNLALADESPTARKQKLEALWSRLEDGDEKANAKRSVIGLWLAKLEQDPKQAGIYARATLRSIEAHAKKVSATLGDGWGMSVACPGATTLALSVNTGSIEHVLRASTTCRPWFLEKKPLSRADLERLAKSP